MKIEMKVEMVKVIRETIEVPGREALAIIRNTKLGNFDLNGSDSDSEIYRCLVEEEFSPTTRVDRRELSRGDVTVVF